MGCGRHLLRSLTLLAAGTLARGVREGDERPRTERLAAAVEWFEAHGGVFNLEFVETGDGGGLGTVGKDGRGFAAGDAVIEVPRALLMGLAEWEDPAIARIDHPDASSRQRLRLVAHVALELRKGDASFWKPYLDTLPTPEEQALLAPVMLEDAEKEALGRFLPEMGDFFRAIESLNATGLAVYDGAPDAAARRAGEAAARTLFLPRREFLYAASIVISRSFSTATLPCLARGAAGGGDALFLAPLLDMINHRFDGGFPSCAAGGGLVHGAAGGAAPGAEVGLAYGERSACKLKFYRSYGYAEPSAADCFTMRLSWDPAAYSDAHRERLARYMAPLVREAFPGEGAFMAAMRAGAPRAGHVAEVSLGGDGALRFGADALALLRGLGLHEAELEALEAQRRDLRRPVSLANELHVLRSVLRSVADLERRLAEPDCADLLAIPQPHRRAAVRIADGVLRVIAALREWVLASVAELLTDDARDLRAAADELLREAAGGGSRLAAERRRCAGEER